MKKLLALFMVITIIITTLGLPGLSAVNATALHDLTISSTAGGMVTTPGEGVFHELDEGSAVSLVATADSGYHFVNWTGNVGTIANVNASSTTITINGDYAITANFAKTASLTMASGGNGSVTPGSGQYTQGQTVSVNATASSGYHFVNWTGDTTALANPNVAATTITLNSNSSVTANFAANSGYYLTINSGANGTTTPGAGTYGPYLSGQVVSIGANPNSGYSFLSWAVNSGTNTINNIHIAGTTIAMNGNKTITPSFISNSASCQLRINTNGHGQIKNMGTVISDIGYFAIPYYGYQSLQEDIVANSGYLFDHWTGDTWVLDTLYYITENPTFHYTITGEVSIELYAEFGPYYGPYDLHTFFKATTGGTVTSPGLGEYNYEDQDESSATAAAWAGYQFVNWTADIGDPAYSPNSATTTMIHGWPFVLTANFTPVNYNLTISAGAGGTASSSGSYNLGQVVNVTATANSGYHFVNWTGNTATMGNPNAYSTTITIANTAAYSITANFAADPASYNLTTAAGSGGTVTAPGLGTQGPYTAGSNVNITASANAGYHFVNWTGNTGTITNTADATAAITINAAYSITANFAADSGPSSKWAFEDGSGSTASDCIGTNDGTIYGGAAWTTGVRGGGLNLDGSNDYVKLPASNQVLSSTAFTVGAWIKTTTTAPAYGSGNEGRIITFHRSSVAATALSLFVASGDVSLMYFNGTTTDTSVKYTVNYHDNAWHYVSVTYDGTFRLYYDGVQRATKTDSLSSRGSKNAYIGSYYDAQRLFTGDVDEVSIYNRVLTSQEISDQYTTYFPTVYLTISSGDGGSVTTPGEGEYSYTTNQVVDIVAQPAANHHFVGWSGDNGTIANTASASTTITMNGNYTITANFADNTYSLTVYSTDGGTVTDPGLDTYNYAYGENVTLIAVPEEGMRFDGWTGEDVSTILDTSSTNTTITMNGDYEITANFSGNEKK